MKPKAVNEKNWDKMKKKYPSLNFEIWSYLDGIEKINVLKDSQIEIKPIYFFGKNYNLKYPKDIYMFENTEKIVLDPITLTNFQNMVLYEKKEVGGTLNFLLKTNNFKTDIFFTGTETSIDLNLEKDTQTLFHTHPINEKLDFDPPSILDIVSFLALNVKFIAESIIDLRNGIEHGIDDLIVQNSMVFTKNEVYVYYISSPLILNITKYLMKLKNKDFIYNVEKLLEMIEIHYSIILSSFNKNLNNEEIEEYLKILSSLGILIKRFSYLDNPEIYNLI